jgi:hypothetical protein
MKDISQMRPEEINNVLHCRDLYKIALEEIRRINVNEFGLVDNTAIAAVIDKALKK